MPKEKRELRVYWSKKEDDVSVWGIRGPDRALALGSLCQNPINPAIGHHYEASGLSFLGELERRGYDLSTLKLTIALRDDHPWIRRGVTLYPIERTTEAMRVEWVRFCGDQVTVYMRRHNAPDERGKVGGMPDYGRGFSVELALSIGEVERRYQRTPFVDDVLDVDGLPPMCPRLPTT